MKSRKKWEQRFAAFLGGGDKLDLAHDRGHILRVAATAESLAKEEGARLDIVLPAAWLHDCVAVAKDDPKRGHASSLAASAATVFLLDSGYDSALVPAIGHAIESHSFSAGIEPKTLEARIVRDADRLDAIGAIGIARCFMTGTDLGSQLYNLDEPLPSDRVADDRRFMIDHFFTKLLRLEQGMTTTSGRREARTRSDFMSRFLDQLMAEIGESPQAG